MTKQQTGAAIVLGLFLIAAAVTYWPTEPRDVATASALQDYVTSNRCEPFAIRRNKWGAGTENIVW